MSKGFKIPKKVAGFKIPRTLRKSPVSEFLNSTAGRMLIAEAVAIGVAALLMRRNHKGERTGAVLANRVAEFGSASQDGMRRTSDRLASAMHAGLDAFRKAGAPAH